MKLAVRSGIGVPRRLISGAVFLTAGALTLALPGCEPEPIPTTLRLHPDSLVFSALGDTATISATVLDELANPILGASVSWLSDNPGIASADTVGVVTSTGNGVTSVRAVIERLVERVHIEVQQVVDSLSVDPPAHVFDSVGQSLMITVDAFDPLGARFPEAELIWTSTDTAVASVDELGQVAAQGPGLATIRVTADSSFFADVAITVMPAGELALLDNRMSLHLARINGSAVALPSFHAPTVREPSLDWSRDGRRLVVGGYAGARVFDLPSGMVLLSPWPAAGGDNVIWPRFDVTGDTIYYSSLVTGNSWDLRRAAVDGSKVDVIIDHDSFPRNDFMPDLSSDGRTMVYTADWEELNKFLLRVMDFTTGTTTTVHVEGVTPVWSPDGSFIGFQELGLVGVVRPDGTELSLYSPGWSKGVTFSPDGEWLVGIRQGEIEVLRLATGEVIPLTHLGNGYIAVAWRPQMPSPVASTMPGHD